MSDAAELVQEAVQTLNHAEAVLRLASLETRDRKIALALWNKSKAIVRLAEEMRNFADEPNATSP